MLSSIARLRRVAELAAVGKPLSDDGPWLADAIRRYLEGAPRGLTLDAALGVEAMPFQGAWWEREATACRDELIRRMVAFFPQHAMAPSRLAKEIAASAWPTRERT